MKKIIFTTIFVLALAAGLLLAPVRMPARDVTFGKNAILLEYEYFEHGAILRRVRDGGEEISQPFSNEYKDIGSDEVMFSEDSDEPLRHMRFRLLQNGYLKGKTFVVYGEATRPVEAARDCCYNKGAINSIVAEFKVKSWQPTFYMPRVLYGSAEFTEYVVIGVCMYFIAVFIYIIGDIIYRIFRRLKKQKSDN